MPFAKSSVRLGIRRHFRKSGVSAQQKIVVPRGAEVFRRDTGRSDMVWSLNLGLTAGKRLPS